MIKRKIGVYTRKAITVIAFFFIIFTGFFTEEYIMRRGNNLSGSAFGSLTVLTRVYGSSSKYKKNSHWICNCSCGKTIITTTSNLKRAHTTSCGCSRINHNWKDYPEYNSWSNMIQRTTNPKHDSYKNYGERGICVDEKWIGSFKNFFADMGEKPTPLHSIERVDNNKGYNSSNCIWATPKEQGNNKRTNVPVFVNGTYYRTVKNFAESINENYRTVLNRVTRGYYNA